MKWTAKRAQHMLDLYEDFQEQAIERCKKYAEAIKSPTCTRPWYLHEAKYEGRVIYAHGDDSYGGYEDIRMPSELLFMCEEDFNNEITNLTVKRLETEKLKNKTQQEAKELREIQQLKALMIKYPDAAKTLE